MGAGGAAWGGRRGRECSGAKQGSGAVVGAGGAGWAARRQGVCNASGAVYYQRNAWGGAGEVQGRVQGRAWGERPGNAGIGSCTVGAGDECLGDTAIVRRVRGGWGWGVGALLAVHSAPASRRAAADEAIGRLAGAARATQIRTHVEKEWLGPKARLT